MGRNNEKNIRQHNDKLHKAQAKVKNAAVLRKEKLAAIIKKFNSSEAEPEKNTHGKQI